MGFLGNLFGVAAISIAVFAAGADAAKKSCPSGTAFYGVTGIGSTTSRFVLNLNEKSKCGSLFEIDKGVKTDSTTFLRTEDEINLIFAPVGISFTGIYLNPTVIRGGIQFSPVGPTHSLSLTSTEEYVPSSVPLTPDSVPNRAHATRLVGLAAQWTTKRGATTTPVIVYGQRGAAISAPMAEADDLWHIGSNTKSMTATLAGVLVEHGLFTWDTPLHKLLNDTVPTMRDDYADVTPLQLMSHRAGFQANIAVGDLMKFSIDPLSHDATLVERREMATLALQQAPVGPAGKQELYSNNGFIVMGYAMEVITGKSWESLMQEYVFTPLGMTTAGFGPAGMPPSRIEPLIVPERLTQPAGHVRSNNDLTSGIPNWGTRCDNPVALGPAGRVHISTSDLLKYVRAHMNKHPLLKPATWDVLHTRVYKDGRNALGWVVNDEGDAMHDGSNTANYAIMGFNANKKAAAVVLSNDASSPVGISEIFTAAFKASKE